MIVVITDRSPSNAIRSARIPSAMIPRSDSPSSRAGAVDALANASEGEQPVISMRFSHSLVHGEHTPGEHPVSRAGDAGAHLNGGTGELEESVAHPQSGDGIGDEHESTGAQHRPRRANAGGVHVWPSTMIDAMTRSSVNARPMMPRSR